jgi:hypothetical protein
MGCHPARVRVSWLNLLSLLLALFGLAAVSWIEPHFVLYSNDAPMRSSTSAPSLPSPVSVPQWWELLWRRVLSAGLQGSGERHRLSRSF